MFKRVVALLLTLAVAPLAIAADPWIEGRHFYRLEPVRPISTPAGTIEVVEVFSYACPACDAFRPLFDGLRATLPPKVKVVYMPASFNAAEDWPMFQRAYFAAKRLGIDEKTHTAMFAAIWQSGELAVVDPRTRRLRSPAPALEDAAAFYEKNAGVKPAQFLGMAHSFSVDLDVRSADEYIRSSKVDSTPQLIINGKYRISGEAAGSFPRMIEVARWLIAREGG